MKKGNRAGALKRISYGEASNYDKGGFVDESFPTDAVREILASLADCMDIPAFEAFFAQKIGFYRMMVRSENMPSVSEELALLDETIEHISQLRMRLTHLPPMARCHINAVCWKGRGELYSDFARRLDDELNAAWMLIAGTEQVIEPHKGQVGAKTKTLRDQLLHDVAHWLQRSGTGKTQAAGLAADILRATGIPAPAGVDTFGNAREARRIVSQVERWEK